MKRKIVALLTGAMLMAATSAMATPISGTISFTGNDTLTSNNGTTTATSLATATGVIFQAPLSDSIALGDFASVLLGTVSFNNITNFSPLSLTNPLWTVTKGGATYTFQLTSITETIAGGHLLLDGVGIVTGTNGTTVFDATNATWSFSTDGVTSTFSATTTVPEPGSMVLLGIGMLGLAVYGKRRMNKEA